MGSQRVRPDWVTKLYCRASLCRFKKSSSSGGWITKRAPFFGRFYHSFNPPLGTLVRGIINDTHHAQCPDLWGSWKTKESSLRISGQREGWMGLPRWLGSRESAGAMGDWNSIPGWGRSPGGGNSNPRQYSCQDSPVNRGAWWATVRGGYKESDATEQWARAHRRAAWRQGWFCNLTGGSWSILQREPNKTKERNSQKVGRTRGKQCAWEPPLVGALYSMQAVMCVWKSDVLILSS